MTLKELRASLALHRKRRSEYDRKAKKYRAAARRAKRSADLRRRQIAARTSGPGKAIDWALAQVGTTENPAGSNRGGKITEWQQGFGDWLVGQAWCGVFVGTALRHAGVGSAVSWRVASVAFIEDDARAGRNGFSKVVPLAEAARGDVVVLFGRGVHVGLVVSNRGTWLETVEGNTSPGNTGSQSNGGGVFKRVRPNSAVHVVVRPTY